MNLSIGHCRSTYCDPKDHPIASKLPNRRPWRVSAVASLVALTLLPVAGIAADEQQNILSESSRAHMANLDQGLSEPLVHNSRFVYSSEEKLNFDLELYLQQMAPRLLPHRELISHWSGHTTISPRIALTLIELKTGSISAQSSDSHSLTRLFGDLSSALDFEDQLTDVLERLSKLFYQSPEGADRLRAKSAADLALLQLLGPDSTPRDLDRLQDVYHSLFPTQEPLAESAPGLAAPTKAVPPSNLMQLPFPVGRSWFHNGAHLAGGIDNRSLSSLDFYQASVPWGTDVGNHWVVAAHSGRISVLSSCKVEIIGPDGWSTQYNFLDNIQFSGGQSVTRNQRIANYADNRAQAGCQGGGPPMPYVHFSLLRNGQFVSLQDVELSNYRVQTGRHSNDKNCTFSYLERGDIRSCPLTRLSNDGGISVAPPRDLSATAQSGGRIQLTWSYSSSNGNGFEIQRSQSNNFQTIATLPAGARSHADTNLAPGTYRYRVRALSSSGPSGYSNVATATSGERVPSNLSAAVLSHSEVELTWNDESNSETGYEIEGKVGSSPFRPMANVSANTESLVLTELSPLTRYTFRVRATGGLGSSGYSNQASALTFTDDPQPCIPDDRTSCLTQERFAVQVTWKNALGETGSGRPVPGNSADSGMIWFFEQDNWEMLVKVLNGCSSNNRFWVFAGAATNVEYTLTITDTLTGHQAEYFKPLGPPAPTTKDIEAFATCAAG